MKMSQADESKKVLHQFISIKIQRFENFWTCIKQ
jgi:hypothetical protein